MNIVAYGGGVNSTAMCIGLYERKIKVGHILFADTGGERPEVYDAVEKFSKWLVDHGMPAIATVRHVNKAGAPVSLEQECLNSGTLPSLAYGFKTCSLKHKKAPQDKYVNSLPEAKAVWKSGGKVTKFIGYDADEERRAKIREDEKYLLRYPLIEWGWGRPECLSAIRRAKLACEWPKSSCFFCPAMKKHEIRALPESLKERAIAIERNAAPNLQTVAGLGRTFNWEQFLKNDHPDLFGTEIETPCDCYDGSSE